MFSLVFLNLGFSQTTHCFVHSVLSSDNESETGGFWSSKIIPLPLVWFMWGTGPGQRGIYNDNLLWKSCSRLYNDRTKYSKWYLLLMYLACCSRCSRTMNVLQWEVKLVTCPSCMNLLKTTTTLDLLFAPTEQHALHMYRMRRSCWCYWGEELL